MENSKINFVRIKLVRDGQIESKEIIDSMDKAVDFVADYMKEYDREYFVVLNLDTKLKVINANVASIGSIDKTLIHPREIFKASILSNASGVIFLHNHPSGNPMPSKEDIEITNRLIKAGKVLGIDILDHIVVGEKKYISLRNDERCDFYKSDLSNEELKKWDEEYEQEKLVKEQNTDNFVVERNIDGIPYKFELSLEEIKDLYGKFENSREKEKEREIEMETRTIYLVYDKQYDTYEAAEEAINGSLEHLTKNELKSLSRNNEKDSYFSIWELNQILDEDKEWVEDFQNFDDPYKLLWTHPIVNIYNDYYENVLEAAKYDAKVLKYVHPSLKEDKEIALIAIKNNVWDLINLSDELQSDKEVVIEAVKNNGEALDYVSEDLRNDKEIVFTAIKNNYSSVFYYASDELKKDKEFILKLIDENIKVIKYIDEDLKSDKDFLLQIVQKRGLAIQFFDEKFANDEKIALQAVKNNEYAMEYVGRDLRENKEFLQKAYSENKNIADFLDKKVLENIKFENSREKERDISPNSFEGIREKVSALCEENHRDFVKSIISIEESIDDENILDEIYDSYLKDDDMKFINDKFSDLAYEVREREFEKAGLEFDIPERQMGI